MSRIEFKMEQIEEPAALALAAAFTYATTDPGDGPAAALAELLSEEIRRRHRYAEREPATTLDAPLEKLNPVQLVEVQESMRRAQKVFLAQDYGGGALLCHLINAKCHELVCEKLDPIARH